jgi:hypothetical protein
MARHLRVTALLDEVAAVDDRLIANEREMIAHLREKYADPGHGDGDDAAGLEIILRNVEIRRGFEIDPKTHTPLAFEAKTTS